MNGGTRGGTYISYSMGVRERSARRQGFTKRTNDGGIGFRTVEMFYVEQWCMARGSCRV